MVIVFLCGGAGSVLRYGVTLLADAARGRAAGDGDFPWSTLAVNVVGCGVIALVASTLTERPLLRLGVAVGLLGGFTTFSAFGLETARLFAAGFPGRALAYALATNVAGLGAAALLFRIAAPAAPGLP